MASTKQYGRARLQDELAEDACRIVVVFLAALHKAPAIDIADVRRVRVPPQQVKAAHLCADNEMSIRMAAAACSLLTCTTQLDGSTLRIFVTLDVQIASEWRTCCWKALTTAAAISFSAGESSTG